VTVADPSSGPNPAHAASARAAIGNAMRNGAFIAYHL
jgi:hypothetical protein